MSEDLILGAGQMASWLRVFTVLAKDLSVIPNTHIRPLITTTNYSFRSSNTLLHRDMCFFTHRITHRYTYIQRK